MGGRKRTALPAAWTCPSHLSGEDRLQQQQKVSYRPMQCREIKCTTNRAAAKLCGYGPGGGCYRWRRRGGQLYTSLKKFKILLLFTIPIFYSPWDMLPADLYPVLPHTLNNWLQFCTLVAGGIPMPWMFFQKSLGVGKSWNLNMFTLIRSGCRSRLYLQSGGTVGAELFPSVYRPRRERYTSILNPPRYPHIGIARSAAGSPCTQADHQRHQGPA